MAEYWVLDEGKSHLIIILFRAMIPKFRHSPASLRDDLPAIALAAGEAPPRGGTGRRVASRSPALTGPGRAGVAPPGRDRAGGEYWNVEDPGLAGVE